MFHGPISDKKTREIIEYWNSPKVHNFETFGGDTRIVYAKIHSEYWSGISWHSTKQTKFEMNTNANTDFVDIFLWFSNMLLVWFPQRLCRQNFFRKLEFVEILLSSLRRKFEINLGKPSAERVKK